MVRTIDECFFQIQNGANIKQGDVDGGFPITRIETIANDKFNRDRMGYAGITDISKYEAYVLEDGDLLMSHINSVQYLGRTVLYVKEQDETIIHGMNLLRLKAKRDIINPAYARYCFYGHPFRSQISNITKKSVNQASFAVKDLKQIKIEVPTVLEQNEIVEVLDKIQLLIELRTSELLKLDELIKARFVELFGDINEPSKWMKKPWYELVTIQNGRDYKNILVESGGYPVYGTGGEMARASEYLCPENTIIVGRKGTINNPLLVKEKFWNVDTAFGVIVGNQLHYQYFYNFCRLFDFSTLNKQAVLPSTTKADLLKIEMAVPPMEIQKQFATFVQQVDKSKVVVQKALDEAQLLFDSLMQKYFG